MKLSETKQGINWVGQFRPEDQRLACLLLDSLTLISHDELTLEIRNLAEQIALRTSGMIGLFAEREVRRGKGGVPNRMYKEPYKQKNRRAYGSGPQPVKPKHSYDLTVGSEGIIAWLVSDICRQYPTRFISHPSPNQVRSNHVRKFVIVTDLIGSGKRVCEYLESAWRVASVRSWNSLKLLDFEVIAFTGTDAGMSIVKRHKTKPRVVVAKSCPTIFTEFNIINEYSIRSLCIRYDPITHDPVESLGFKGSGALIVFSHGCPNNVPRFFFSTNYNKTWIPLFPKRGTSSCQDAFKAIDRDSELRRKLAQMNEKRLAQGNWIDVYSDEGKQMLMVLAALRRGPVQSDAISRRTGLTIPQIEILIENGIRWDWLDLKRRLTTVGKGQLNYARNIKIQEKELDEGDSSFYFPKSLRAPADVSSSR